MIRQTIEKESLNKNNSLKNFSDIIFIFAVFLIILITIVSFYQFQKLSKANNWVTHTYEVALTAINSRYLFNYIESRQREYLLFDDSEALQDFNLSEEKMNNSIKQLMQLTIGNIDQQKKVKYYNQIIEDRIVLFNKAIDLKKQGKYTGTQKNKLFSQGKNLSHKIDSISNEIINSERILLHERNARLIKEINIINYVVLLSQIISVFFLLLAFIISRNRFRQRLIMESNAKNLTIQLKSIIEGANDMIVAVDLQYRYIIFNEAFRNEFKKIFGKDIEIGKSLEDIFSDQPEIKDILLNTWKKSLSGDNTNKSLQFPIDGSINTYELTPSLIKNEDGTAMGALHIIRNITERIREQNQLRESYDRLNKATNDLKIKNEKITLLLEMSDILLVTNSIEELSAVIPNYCTKILSFSSGNFYIMRASRDILEISGHWGNPTIKTDVFIPDQCWALRLGRTHHSSLNSHDLHCDHIHLKENVNVGYICLPLRAKNEVFGVLYIEFDLSVGNKLSDTEKLLINAFAEVMALALANVRLRDNLRYQSIRDPLTALYNRRYLEEFLTNQLILAQRELIPVTILIMDLDHFKRINDVHGHDAGDMVLKEFSRTLLKFVRRSDLATRFGGEEFVVVLFDSNKDAGMKRADEFRETISHLNMKYGNQDIHISVSIGVSSFPENAIDGKELLELADKALYRAKKNGRNQVIHYDDVVESEIVNN